MPDVADPDTAARVTLAAPAGSVAPVVQTVTVLQDTPADFAAAIRYLSPVAGWLTVTPAGGKTPATLTLTATPTNLPPGVYAAQLTVTAGPLGTAETHVTVGSTTNSVIAADPSGVTFFDPWYSSAPPGAGCHPDTRERKTRSCVVHSFRHVSRELAECFALPFYQPGYADRYGEHNRSRSWRLQQNRDSGAGFRCSNGNPGYARDGRHRNADSHAPALSNRCGIQLPDTGFAAPAPGASVSDGRGHGLSSVHEFHRIGVRQLDPPDVGSVAAAFFHRYRHCVRAVQRRYRSRPVLAQGIHSGSIVVSSPGLADIQLAVSVNIGPDQALNANPSSVILDDTIALAQTIVVTSTGSGSLTFTATPQQGAPWLRVTPSSASTASGAAHITISADTTGLAAGVYSGVVALTPPGSTGALNIPVRLNVSGPSNGAGALTPSESAVALSGILGLPLPSKTILLDSTVPGASHPFTASASSTGGWLVVDPFQGTAPTKLTVRVKPAAEQPPDLFGKHYADLTADRDGDADSRDP